MSVRDVGRLAFREVWDVWEKRYRETRRASVLLTNSSAPRFVAASQRNFPGSSLPFAPYGDRGDGPYLYDIDGNRYIDVMAGWNSCFLGRSQQQIADAVHAELLRRGAPSGEPFPAQIRDELAQLICERVPGAERVLFAATGSDANGYALRLARAITGRSKFIRFAGAYHGMHDEFVWNGPLSTGGLPQSAGDNVLLCRFNDRDAVTRILEEYGDEIAAVITEPILGMAGFIEQRDHFLRYLRQVTEQHDVLLILDEVITGFRFAMGGATEYYKLSPPPDMITLGKMLGGGLPVAAVAGRAAILDAPIVATVTHAHNPACHVAALTFLQTVTDAHYLHANKLGQQLRQGLRAVVANLGLRIQITGDGTNAGVHMTSEEVTDAAVANRSDAQLASLVRLGMYLEGVNMATRGLGVTAAFQRADVEHVIGAVGRVLGDLCPAIESAAPELMA